MFKGRSKVHMKDFYFSTLTTQPKLGLTSLHSAHLAFRKTKQIT